MSNFLDKLRNAHQSLTLWFNSVVMSIVSLLPMLVDQFPQMQPYLPENVYKAAMSVLVVGNILLRFKTSKSLADK